MATLTFYACEEEPMPDKHSKFFFCPKCGYAWAWDKECRRYVSAARQTSVGFLVDSDRVKDSDTFVCSAVVKNDGSGIDARYTWTDNQTEEQENNFPRTMDEAGVHMCGGMLLSPIG